MMEINSLRHSADKLKEKVAIYPLVTFRVLFGGLMIFSILRFWLNGWIEDFYITPTHFFPYFGLDWIQPYNSAFIYSLFIIMALAALGILLGAFYRASAIAFFLAFTYVELIDKTTYLNHYYFISLIAFLLIWTPAHKAISVDSKLFPRIKTTEIQRWSITILQAQIALVYVFAGIAKLNSTWLLDAQPMSLWLDSKSNFPLVGELLSLNVTAYVFSWAGMLFDLFIVLFLLSNKLRLLGYFCLVVFHLFTWLLFPIGVFPWVMIGLTLIYFSGKWHKKLWIKNSTPHLEETLAAKTLMKTTYSNFTSKICVVGLGCYFLIQLLLPMRHAVLPGDLYWAETGFRFSWRVMLMEKTGHVEFVIKDTVSNKTSIIDNSDYFTAFQIRELSTQPDMILQAANIIANDFKTKGRNVAVYANSFASLNGKKHQQLINPEVNLAAVENDFNLYWIRPHEH